MKVEPDSLKCILGVFQKTGFLKPWVAAVLTAWVNRWLRTHELRGNCSVCCHLHFPQREWIYVGGSCPSLPDSRVLEFWVQWKARYSVKKTSPTPPWKPQPEDLELLIPGERAQQTEQQAGLPPWYLHQRCMCEVGYGRAVVNKINESVSWSQEWFLRKTVTYPD